MSSEQRQQSKGQPRPTRESQARDMAFHLNPSFMLCQLARHPPPIANVSVEYLEAETFITMTYPDLQKLRHLETVI